MRYRQTKNSSFSAHKPIDLYHFKYTLFIQNLLKLQLSFNFSTKKAVYLNHFNKK